MRIASLILLTILSSNILGQNITCQTSKTTTMAERYDYTRTENGTRSVSYLEGDWYIIIGSMSFPLKEEFAPAESFFKIEKLFYPNGNLRHRGTMFGSVRVGKWCFYDENGTLKREIDEEVKFGSIKPHHILNIMEQEGVINRQTGTSVLSGKFDVPATPFIDGRFYMYVARHLGIRFHVNSDLQDNKSVGCFWTFHYVVDGAHTMSYRVDGETGEITKELLYTPTYE